LSTEQIQDNIDIQGGSSANVSGNIPLPAHDPTNGGQNEDEDEDGVDDGPTLVQAHVQLARTPRTFAQLLEYQFIVNIISERRRAKTVPALAVELNIPHLPNLLRYFLFQQMHPGDLRELSEVPENRFPGYTGTISVFNSASSRFYAPSDISGIGGMRTEYIRACPLWRNEHPRHDCVFVTTKPEQEGMKGFDVARIMCFFSFAFRGKFYPCAVIRWFDTIGDSPDEDSGMWIVRPAYNANHSPNLSVIHIDAIYRAAHLHCGK
jgi:hypothetical protein